MTTSFRTALVTGATGHVGNNLVRALIDHGADVTALVHRPEHAHALDGLDVRRANGDILDEDSLKQAMQGCEVVFHCAAIVSIASKPFPELFRVNVEGVANVVRAAHLTDVRRIVHFSSIHAFSPYPLSKPVTESSPPSDTLRTFVPPYDISKAKGERVVLDATNVGVETVIVNPTAVIGPHDYLLSPVGRLLLDLYHRRLPALVTGSFDWVDVRDIAQGAISAADRGRSGERYLLTGTRASVREFVDRAAAASGVPAPKLSLPVQLAYLGLPFIQLASRFTGRDPLFTRTSLHTLQRHCDISGAKARAELDFHARPLDDSLRDAYAWFGEQGKLA